MRRPISGRRFHRRLNLGQPLARTGRASADRRRTLKLALGFGHHRSPSIDLRGNLGQLCLIPRHSATVAPASASANAHARPIPCDAPVTNATLPASVLMCLHFF